MEKRIKLVFLLIIIIFIVISVRLFYWQVSSFDVLKGLAEKQTSSTLLIPAKRGVIYSSDKSPLVINQKAYSIYLETKKIENLKETVKKLANTLEMDEASISSKIADQSLYFVPIARKVDENKADNLKNLSLKGVDMIEESKRYYPESSMSAHLLGFVGKNSKGEDQGYFGIEGYYDSQLKGRDGMRKFEVDAQGNPILAAGFEDVPAENGRNIVLTIDKTVQFLTEKKLLDGIEKYGAKGGTVIVMEPKTGAILAMASYPSYDPAKYYNYPNEWYKNPGVSFYYEPGSTFKVLVMAAALNEKKINPDTKFYETGPINIGGFTIKTWDQQYRGEISLSQILEYSSNVGMVDISAKLGDDLLLRYLEKLGFGATTGIDLQEEFSPDLRPSDKWYKIDFATASFGQGIAVTPLQMIRAVGAIANGGKLMKPYLVKSIELDNGKTIQTRNLVVRNVYNKEATSLVTEMMVSAVENGETRMIKPAGYRIAGKTGTAQIPIAGHYDAEKTIASFVGFAPVEDPKFIMLVTVREPTLSPWGSETAAPIFFSIAKDLFSYYSISP